MNQALLLLSSVEKRLPTGLSRAIVIATILGALAFVTTSLLSNRYELVAATKSDNAIVYRLDRLTGRVSFCSASQCNVLPNRAEAAN